MMKIGLGGQERHLKKCVRFGHGSTYCDNSLFLGRLFVFLFIGAAYGQGTYFAVNAKYSANDKYSTPDSNGRKHVYVVRVLTGVYTCGHARLVTPPSKNPHNPTDLFDSVTDDTQHPSLFVVFSDNQAYPEYLITFRC